MNKNLDNRSSSFTESFFSPEFVPQDVDVIVGRAKDCYDHAGNEKLRCLVDSMLEEYSTSVSKNEKSNMLSLILFRILNDGGSFIKNDPQTGLWFNAGEFLARKKISQTFRDALRNKNRRGISIGKTLKKSRQPNKGIVDASSCLPLSKINVLSNPKACNNEVDPIEALRKKVDEKIRRSILNFNRCIQDANILRKNVDVRKAHIFAEESEDSLPTQLMGNLNDPFEPIPIEEVFFQNAYENDAVRSNSDITYNNSKQSLSLFEPIKVDFF